MGAAGLPMARLPPGPFLRARINGTYPADVQSNSDVARQARQFGC